MAAPNYTEDLTDLTLCEATTGFTALGGGASGLGTGADFAIQGTLAVDKQITSALKGMIWDNGSTITNTTGLHYFIWIFPATPGICDSLANGGVRATIGTSTSDYMDFYVNGNDTLPQGGMRCYPIRYTTTATATRVKTGTPGANAQWIGGQLKTTAAAKGANLGIDAMRYGTGAYITSGDSGTPATFAGFAAQNDSNANRWGILSLNAGVYQLQGRFVIGQDNTKVATAAYFSDANRTITLTDTPHSETDFTQFIIDHASTTCIWTNITILSLGTNNPGRLVFNNASTTGTLTSCSFTSMGITTLRAGVTADGCTWRACDQITANAAIVKNSLITGYTGAANSSALVWNDNVDPNGKLDGTEFVKGSGDTHAIEFGTTSPLTMTLTNVLFTGYGADGTNSAAVHVKRTSGTVTINVSGGNSPTYRSDGATVVIQNTVTVGVTAKSAATSGAIENARVLIEADTGGDLPAGASVSITRSGSTATVTHTAHGLATGAQIIIRGAAQSEYNGDKTITVTGANDYTFTVSGTPTSPATGTITATYRIINALTNASGVAQDTGFKYTNPQPIVGVVRKGSASPLYKSSPISGSISSTGFSTNVFLVGDE